MGNTSSDHNIKDALEELSDCRKIKTLEDAFWTSYFQSSTMPVEQLLEMVSLDDIRQIKSKNRSNFVTLCLHCMTQIFKSCKNSFWSQRHLLTVNNSVKWLIRLFPAVLEDKEMINYLWETKNDACLQPHAHCLLQNICELLFRQGYTVAQTTDAVYPPDPFNTQIIWKPGLVVTEATESNTFLDENRKLLLCLLLLLLSQELYLTRDGYIFP
uniref:Protein HID1 (Trinotate prediction) n=1 Tax=Henneguya salminicola TaxID=69463 RepID=A0A6G3ME45_HENSL